MKIAILVSTLLSLSVLGYSGDRNFAFRWSKHTMDGSRTGCISAGADDIDKTIGRVDGRAASHKVYYAPNGKIFTAGTIADVAEIVIDAQPAMRDMKTVIGYAPKSMVRGYPESEISNMFVDVIMSGTQNLSGKKVDVGIANFGGLRIDMPEGDIFMDDILSMFPFKNTVVYLELSGRDLMEIFSTMAASRFQILGGVKIEAKDGKLESVLIGGEPVDNDKMYGVATISFLLNGGDNLYLARNAHNIKVFDADIKTIMLDYVRKETAEGRQITYHTDGRIVIR